MHKNNKSLRKQKKKSQVFDQNFENQRKSRFKKKKKKLKENQPGLQKVTRDFQNLAAQQTSAVDFTFSNSHKEIYLRKQ
jgi:hypothetical protein